MAFSAKASEARPRPLMIHHGSCGWDGSWHSSGGSVMLIRNLVGVNESAPGASVLSRR